MGTSSTWSSRGEVNVLRLIALPRPAFPYSLCPKLPRTLSPKPPTKATENGTPFFGLGTASPSGPRRLARKTNLAKTLRRMEALLPDDYNFMPRTWVRPEPETQNSDSLNLKPLQNSNTFQNWRFAGPSGGGRLALNLQPCAANPKAKAPHPKPQSLTPSPLPPPDSSRRKLGHLRRT